MRYRKLRIAWSIACGVACLLLVALWVRSYYRADVLSKPDGTVGDTVILSNRGRVYYYHHEPPIYRVPGNLGWDYSQTEASYWDLLTAYVEAVGGVSLPHWILLVLTGALAVVPWLRWRFSLRTLMIGITVAAIGLGWIVYALRN